MSAGCSSCGHENPEGHRFCGRCGSRLTSRMLAESRRRSGRLQTGSVTTALCCRAAAPWVPPTSWRRATSTRWRHSRGRISRSASTPVSSGSPIPGAGWLLPSSSWGIGRQPSSMARERTHARHLEPSGESSGRPISSTERMPDGRTRRWRCSRREGVAPPSGAAQPLGAVGHAPLRGRGSGRAWRNGAGGRSVPARPRVR